MQLLGTCPRLLQLCRLRILAGVLAAFQTSRILLAPVMTNYTLTIIPMQYWISKHKHQYNKLTNKQTEAMIYLALHRNFIEILKGHGIDNAGLFVLR